MAIRCGYFKKAGIVPILGMGLTLWLSLNEACIFGSTSKLGELMRLSNSAKDKMFLALGSMAMFAQPIFADDTPAAKPTASLKPAGKAVARERNGVSTAGKHGPTPASSSSSPATVTQQCKASSSKPNLTTSKSEIELYFGSNKLTPARQGQFTSPRGVTALKAPRISGYTSGSSVDPERPRRLCTTCGRG